MGMAADAVRRANLSQVLRLLHLEGAITRAEVTAATGLNRSTVGILVAELVSLGLVNEGDPQLTGSRGRPSPLVSLCSRRTVVVVLDIKVDSIAAGAVGLGGDIVMVRRQDRPRVRTTVDTTVADLTDLARTVLSELGPDQRVMAVSISVVGLVNDASGTVDEGPNLGWQRAPLANLVRQALGVDLPVMLVNDGDAGVWAESRRGVAVHVDDVLYLSGEVGLGGGILAGGAPLRGAMGYAGEIGHTVLDPSGPPCRCGSTGCMEVLVGENALLREAGRDEDGGQRAVDEVMAAFARGEPAAVAGVARVGEWLAIGVANLVNVLNTRMVVLGDLHARLHPHVVATIEDRLWRQSLVARRSPVDVVAAALGPNASIIGAAELALEPLLDNPAGHDQGPTVAAMGAGSDTASRSA